LSTIKLEVIAARTGCQPHLVQGLLQVDDDLALVLKGEGDHAAHALVVNVGIAIVVDEVQSGVGRTGKMWAIEHFGIEPDIIATAKGLGSGMPIGAVIAKEHWMRWKPGSHGSTFGGNPVAAAAAIATLEVIRDEKLMENATARGKEAVDGLRAALKGNSTVTDIRGIGLMIGVDFTDADTAAEVEVEAFKRGLLVLTCGDRGVRMSPPLVVNAEEIKTAVRIFAEAAAAVAARR
jgi:4-aminobutyrate aminotransferase